jgi:hypothetical protein
MVSHRLGLALLALVTVTIFASLYFIPRIPQPLNYHNFADHRTWLGIPNFGNVASNLPFAVFGLMGFLFLFRSASRTYFLDPRERWPWFFFSLGLFLTAFGSGYYHLHPSNATLLWDRLPMTIAFMSVIAALTAEYINVRAGIYALTPLLIVGASSPVQWYLSELRGQGDLRFYAAVQVYAVILLPLFILLLAPRYTRSADFGVVAAFYLLAKLLETFDSQIFSAGHLASGHTLKHLAAGMAGYWILRMLRLRRPVSPP